MKGFLFWKRLVCVTSPRNKLFRDFPGTKNDVGFLHFYSIRKNRLVAQDEIERQSQEDFESLIGKKTFFLFQKF